MTDSLVMILRDLRAKGMARNSRIHAEFLIKALIKRGVLKKAPEWAHPLDMRYYMVTKEWFDKL